jgi:hypothetical protein
VEEEVVLPRGSVRAVDELLEGTRQVLAADAVERAARPALEVGEHEVRPGQELGRTRGVALDDAAALGAVPPQVPVAGHAVGAHRGLARVDRPAHEGAELGLRGRGQDGQAQGPGSLAAALHDGGPEGLALERAPAQTPLVPAPT